MAGIVQAADLLDEGKISSKQLKQLFDIALKKARTLAPSTSGKSREQITDASAIEKMIDEVIAANPKAGGAVSRGQEDHGGIFCWPGDESVKRARPTRRC